MTSPSCIKLMHEHYKRIAGMTLKYLNQFHSYQVSRFIYHLISRFSGSWKNLEFCTSWMKPVFRSSSHTIFNLYGNIGIVGDFLRTAHFSILCGLRNSYESRLRIILPKLTQAGCINTKGV